MKPYKGHKAQARTSNAPGTAAGPPAGPPAGTSAGTSTGTGAPGDAEDVRGGRRRDPALGEPEPLDLFDLEAGGMDRGEGVAAGVAAAADQRPDRVDQALHPGQAGGVGADVLHEATIT